MITRGVGYCYSEGCESRGKGTFLLNHGDTFYCPDCRQIGTYQPERGYYSGDSDVFREVRVEFNFDPGLSPGVGNYRDIAIVRDDCAPASANSYTLQSPLIRTEKRALKVAESILANLNRCLVLGVDGGHEVPSASDFVVCLDSERDAFDARMRALGAYLRGGEG